MDIIKRSKKYKYTEKKDKNKKNVVAARLTGPIEEILNTRTPAGEVIEHETNKHLSEDFKKNYDNINWGKDNSSKKIVKNETKTKYVY
jgi:hypothetical protein